MSKTGFSKTGFMDVGFSTAHFHSVGETVRKHIPPVSVSCCRFCHVSSFVLLSIENKQMFMDSDKTKHGATYVDIHEASLTN